MLLVTLEILESIMRNRYCVIDTLGFLSNSPWLAGIGTELMIDDIHDVNEWFTFKQAPIY